jgi:thiosulfate/3-mercaptopyruvate sulfurtransferase
VSTQWLEAHLDEPSLRVLDCSVVMRTATDGTYSFVGGRDEYAEGHVPGSVFVDVLGELAAKDTPLPMMMPSPAELSAVMGSYGVGPDSQVVLYDRSNHAWAARVWRLAEVASRGQADVDGAEPLSGGGVRRALSPGAHRIARTRARRARPVRRHHRQRAVPRGTPRHETDALSAKGAHRR